MPGTSGQSKIFGFCVVVVVAGVVVTVVVGVVVTDVVDVVVPGVG